MKESLAALFTDEKEILSIKRLRCVSIKVHEITSKLKRSRLTDVESGNMFIMNFLRRKKRGRGETGKRWDYYLCYPHREQKFRDLLQNKDSRGALPAFVFRLAGLGVTVELTCAVSQGECLPV